MTHLWCNGQLLDPLDFSISPSDRGLMHGLGLFETILAIDGGPIFADRHLARLREGCERLGWSFGFPEIVGTMKDLILMNGLATGRARVRLAITAGSGAIHDLALGSDHVVWMSAVPAIDPPLSTSANLSPWRRNERSALAGLKCAAYAENLLALQHAAHLGFEETFFLNTAGHLSEAATSNVFLVKDGDLVTPSLDSGCLPGITRAVVIELAGKLGIRCEERMVSADELHAADEIFITSSIRGVMGVCRFEARTLLPGSVTGCLRDAWNAGVAEKKDG